MASQTNSEAHKSETENATQRVKEVVNALADAWNRKDPDGFATLLTDDGEWTDVVANYVQGREAVRKLHVYPFTTVLKKAHLTLNDIRVRFLKPDVAAVDVTWQTVGQTTPDGTKEVPPRNGLMNLILLYQPDHTWAIAIGHNVDYTAAYQRS